MRAKEYLNRGVRIAENIASKRLEQQRLRELAMSVTPHMGDEPPAHTGEAHSKIESAAVKIADLDAEIDREIDALVDTHREIRLRIEQMHNADERLVLRERYINARSWEDIALFMNYSLRQTMRVHGRGLKNFEKILESCH